MLNVQPTAFSPSSDSNVNGTASPFDRPYSPQPAFKAIFRGSGTQYAAFTIGTAALGNA